MELIFGHLCIFVGNAIAMPDATSVWWTNLRIYTIPYTHTNHTKYKNFSKRKRHGKWCEFASKSFVYILSAIVLTAQCSSTKSIRAQIICKLKSLGWFISIFVFRSSFTAHICTMCLLCNIHSVSHDFHLFWCFGLTIFLLMSSVDDFEMSHTLTYI